MTTKKLISVVCDQTHVNPNRNGHDLFIQGPEIAWSFDRTAAEMYAARNNVTKPGDVAPRRFQAVDIMAEFITMPDGSMHRLCDSSPIELASERSIAKEALLASLTPEQRALLA